MESKFCFFFLLVFCTGVQSASILEMSYDLIMNWGKNFAPSLMSMIECVGAEEAWGCAREKAGKMLDHWGEDVEKERRMWEEEADAEVRASGRSLTEMPSKLGREVMDSVGSLANVLERGMARALDRKHESGGIDSITISTGGDRKKMKKKKPPKIHLIHPMVLPIRKAHKEEKGRNFGAGVQSWVIGERSLPASNSTPKEDSESSDTTQVENDDVSTLEEDSESSLSTQVEEGRGIFTDMWDMGQNYLDSLAEEVVEAEDKENGINGKQSIAEQRGKKKKKKKAILKLLVLGAVIKAKIATLLQILNYKLQVKFFLITFFNFLINIFALWLQFKSVMAMTTTTAMPPQIKFFIIALLSLAINLARLVIEIKNKHNQQPQKEWRRDVNAKDRHTDNRQSGPNHTNIIYYEHAQHQHHYDHEEEESHGWGPWSRSIFPADDSEAEVSDDPSPYKAQERAPLIYSRPYLSRA